MATKEQLRKMRQKYGLGEYRKKGASAAKPHKKRGRLVMAKRGKSRKRGGMLGGFSVNRLLTPKNIAFTLIGAMVAPKLGIASNIGGAVGGYMGAGIAGAGVGYFVAQPAVAMIGNVIPGISGNSAGVDNSW